MDETDLKVGVCYHVKFDDCCVYGEFTSTLTAVVYDPPDDRDPPGTGPTIDRIEFSNGVTLRNLMAVEFVEANTVLAG